MFDKFWQNYGPWHLEVLHILACLLNSIYIFAWIWMTLGRDLAPQVYKCLWGNNSCLTKFGRVMVLDTWVFTYLASLLHSSNIIAWIWIHFLCGEIIYVWQILAELWSLTLRIFTHSSFSSQLHLHICMDLNDTWQGCGTTGLEVHVGR